MKDPFSTDSAVTGNVNRDGEELVRTTVYIDEGINQALLIAKVADGYSSSTTGVCADLLDEFTQPVLGGIGGLNKMQKFAWMWGKWFRGRVSGASIGLDDTVIEINSDHKQVKPEVIDETASKIDSISECLGCSLSSASRYVITVGVNTMIEEYDIDANRKPGVRRVQDSYKEMRFAVNDVVMTFNSFIERDFGKEDRREHNIRKLKKSEFDALNFAEWWQKEIIGFKAEEKIHDKNIELIETAFDEALGEDWREKVEGEDDWF